MTRPKSKPASKPADWMELMRRSSEPKSRRFSPAEIADAARTQAGARRVLGLDRSRGR
jgi:hypothetical protein